MKLFHKAMNEFLFALGVMLQCATGLPFEKHKITMKPKTETLGGYNFIANRINRYFGKRKKKMKFPELILRFIFALTIGAVLIAGWFWLLGILAKG